MNPRYVVQGIFAVTGIIAILASVFNWNWFFNAQNTRFIVRIMGRSRARLFYGTVGIMLIGLFVYIAKAQAL
ncbi:hypothetical protein EZS27_018450 [termite gut metagenome]|uniref:Immunity protein 17 n=1 Tax=termite gut metagenome TaxID=433724 RepID=A0A5J4RG81_9ZZZZ